MSDVTPTAENGLPPGGPGAEREAWERAVLSRVVETVPACDQTPDFISCVAQAILDTRPLPPGVGGAS